MSKNQPQINNSIDSFSLRLLYETDKDVYFVNDLQSGDNLIGYSIMRLKKDEILRMDYVTQSGSNGKEANDTPILVTIAMVPLLTLPVSSENAKAAAKQR